MTGGGNEVEQNMDTVVAEAGIALDFVFLLKDIIVLLLKIVENGSKARL